MCGKMTKTAEKVIENAVKCARQMGHTYVGTEHILLGLLTEKGCIGAKILISRGVEYSTVSDMIEDMTGFGETTSVTKNDMTCRALAVISGAKYEALKCSCPCVATEHILMAMIGESTSTACRLISSHGVKLSEIYADVNAFSDSFAGGEKLSYDSEKKSKSQIRDIPTLKQYGKNLNEEAKKGRFDPLIGREEELQRVIQILSRRNKNNPCLIGEAGVGKTAIAEGLASKIVSMDVPEILENRVIFSVDMSALLAGAKYRGEFEDRMKSLISEVKKNPCVILFIDEIHTIVGAGAAEGAIDASNILKPSLARGEMQIIGASTAEEYRKSVERDSALERRFQPVNIEEPTKEKTLQILHGIKEKYEQHHKIKISDEAINAAVELSERYITDRRYPDKAIDLIDEACSRKKVCHIFDPELKEKEEHLAEIMRKKEQAIKNHEYDNACRIRDDEKRLKDEIADIKSRLKCETKREGSIDGDDVANVVTAMTKIPIGKLMKNDGDQLLLLKSTLNERIIGQTQAIDAVCCAMMRSRTGIKDPSRPCSFIFTGPTGVGKTMLCKELAEYMFSGARSYIKLDMSEYSEMHSVSSLIGSPPGYKGCDDGGRLTKYVKRNPYCVVVFDEIEKAHSDIYGLLLQILDEGKLTDSMGISVSFKNCIVILTSNVGFDGKKKTVRFGFSGQEDDNGIRASDELKRIFPYELLNRIDEIAVFRHLNFDDGEKIAEDLLRQVQERCKRIGVTVDFECDVPHAIAEKCDIFEYGARKLQRAVQKSVEDELAYMIVNGQGDHYVLTSENGKISVRTASDVYHETKS